MASKRPSAVTPTTPTSPSSSAFARPAPPSAYRPSISSTAELTAPSRTVRNRLSRNFEDALKENETVQLSAGTTDESRLGVVFTPPASRRRSQIGSVLNTPETEASPSMQRSRQYNIQPATPIVVPPTPLAGNSPAEAHLAGKSNNANATYDTSIGSIGHNSVSVSPMPDKSTNRRSLLRTAGTASSPDLATLVRKARERGGVIGSNSSSAAASKDKTGVAPAEETTTSAGPSSYSNYNNYLSPNSGSSAQRTRATSSTSSFSIIAQPEPSQTLRPSKKLQKPSTASGAYSGMTSEQSSTSMAPSPQRPSTSGSSSAKETNKVGIVTSLPCIQSHTYN